MATSERTLLGRAYLGAIPTLGVALVAWSLYQAVLAPPSSRWLVVTVATALIGAYTVKIPGLVVRLSLSEPTVFLSTLLFGPAAGTLTAAVDALVMSLRLVPRLRTPHRILFNVGALAASVFPASLLFFKLTGLNIQNPAYGEVESFIGPLYAFALAVFLLNSSIVAIALGVERQESPAAIWMREFPWLSANYLASASIAAILVVFTQAIDFGLIALLLPLLVVSFLAFRNTLGRLDDANAHLSEVNTLYLSTIETLAMAIDAKDQVTHGHIRRVQRFAVGLAQALGVNDDRQLRAIEAAALLHDMGKLAIPEFILNKPGKLTVREFEVMKTHAAVGADLLSAIQFPYPVVPIVRHHHENWDGSGYPDGIRGSDIPIGARILAVVDCYDALTSDRPYRPAMLATQALDILGQRRGRMYDPLVVDTFVRDHARLCSGAELQHLPALLKTAQSDSGRSVGSTTDSRPQHTAPNESLRLLASLSPFPDGPPLTAVAGRLVESLRSIASFDTAALFVLDDRSTDAEVVFAHGSAALSLTQAKIPIAERLTGWVAAHRTAVWNSDAALDLSSEAQIAALTLGSSLPLLHRDALIGVLSLYGRSDQEITISQRRAIEFLLPSIAESIFAALTRPSISIDCTQESTRLAALAALDALLSHDRFTSPGANCAIFSLTLRPRQPGVNEKAADELAAETLAGALSSRHAQERCVLRLADRQFLLCALNGAQSSELEDAVREVSELRGLKNYILSSSPVVDSLELHDRVARALDRSEPSAQSVRAERVH